MPPAGGDVLALQGRSQPIAQGSARTAWRSDLAALAQASYAAARVGSADITAAIALGVPVTS